MNMNKIKIITNPGESVEPKSLFLTDEGEDSRLAYKDTDGRLIIVSNSTSSIEKPIHCSELYYKLKDRAWNKMDGTRFINLNNDTLMAKLYNFQDDMPDSEISFIGDGSESTDWKGSYPEYSEDKQEAFYVCGSLSSSTENIIRSKYNEILGDLNEKEEVYFQNSSKTSMDILSGTVTLDFIKYNSDTYTDTVSLVELINYSVSPGISGLVNLTIQYTKKSDDDRSTGGNGNTIRTTDFAFQAFKYTTNRKTGKTELVRDNIIEEFEDDIELEYINGIIRVSPLANDISECIINKCTVIYGNIE